MAVLASKEISSLILKHRELLERYGVQSIALFGSYAKGRQSEQSDIDLLVEFRDNTYSNFINLTYALEKLLGKPVTIVSEKDISPYMKPTIMKKALRIA